MRSKYKEDSDIESICYKCKKIGHIREKCPQLRRVRRIEVLKKVLIAIWSGNDNSSEQENEKANLCFMAMSDSEEKVSNSNSYSFIELQEAFDSLKDEYKCICAKTKSLRNN